MDILLSIIASLGPCLTTVPADHDVTGAPSARAAAEEPSEAPSPPARATPERQTTDNDARNASAPPRGTDAASPSCTGFVDDDGDGVCDHCDRSVRGCPASPSAVPGVDPYSGLPTLQEYRDQPTLDNLQAAFNGESNAREKYLAFARKADEEGFAAVAVLFRAASKAEGIHAENHAEVIRRLGGVPQSTIETPTVASTRENLEAAIAGESYEWDVMYPGMLHRARADRDRAAIRTLNFARTAERDHARFYRAALADLDNWKEARPFFVCTVCGATVERIDFTKCHSCFALAEKYIRVD